MMSDKEMMRNELNEDWIYRLKVVVMGSKGVGKSTMVYTYIHNTPPNFTLPKEPLPEEPLKFYMVKQHIKSDSPSQINTTYRQWSYEYRYHIWDLSGESCCPETISKLKNQDFFKEVLAFLFIFNDETSYNFIINKLLRQKIQFQHKQVNFIIYNEFTNIKFNKALDEKAKQFAKQKNWNYKKINVLQYNLIRGEIFDSIKNETKFKLNDGVIKLQQIVLRDRNNKIKLRDKHAQFDRRYNKCC